MSAAIRWQEGGLVTDRKFTVEYSRTLNLGEFNSERIGLIEEFDTSMNRMEAFETVRRTVREMAQAAHTERQRAKPAPILDSQPQSPPTTPQNATQGNRREQYTLPLISVESKQGATAYRVKLKDTYQFDTSFTWWDNQHRLPDGGLEEVPSLVPGRAYNWYVEVINKPRRNDQNMHNKYYDLMVVEPADDVSPPLPATSLLDPVDEAEEPFPMGEQESYRH